MGLAWNRLKLGMQLRIPSVKVVGWSPSGAVREKQRQTVNWRAEPSSRNIGYSGDSLDTVELP